LFEEEKGYMSLKKKRGGFVGEREAETGLGNKKGWVHPWGGVTGRKTQKPTYAETRENVQKKKSWQEGNAVPERE